MDSYYWSWIIDLYFMIRHACTHKFAELYIIKFILKRIIIYRDYSNLIRW